MNATNETPYAIALRRGLTNGAKYDGRTQDGTQHRVVSKDGVTVYLVDGVTLACSCPAHQKSGVMCYSQALTLHALRQQSAARVQREAAAVVQDTQRDAAIMPSGCNQGIRLFR